MEEGKRWSGAEWADQKKEILIVGTGGIGSWTAFGLSRIEHELILVDPDNVDETNVSGGQMFRAGDVGKAKVTAVSEICRLFGCTNQIITVPELYSVELGVVPITICGLDNMKARREVFELWKVQFDNSRRISDNPEAIFIDGRLTLEMYEIFTITTPEQAEEYLKEHLFSDEEAQELDCTMKQSTFAAMGIASNIVATLCNWLTNRKLEMDFREIPFHNRFFLPIFENTKNEIKEVVNE